MREHDNGSAGRRRAAVLSPRRLDERGIALPMAMIFVAFLTMLMLAFGVLGQSEGLIATNHMLMAQARAQAESGFERAMWALTAGLADTPPSGSLSSPLPDPMPDEYSGVSYVTNGNIGGYFVQVTAPDPVADPDLRQITARGCVPNCATPRAQRIVQARAIFQPPFPRLEVEAPCALCVRGNVGVSGNAFISGKQAVMTTCGPKKGVVSAGTLNLSGSGAIYGEDGNDTPNEASDYQQGAEESIFDSLTLGPSHMDKLREMAKANGTYFGPGHPNGQPASDPPWGGSIAFNSSNKLKNGIVFVDTVSGNEIPEDHAAQNTADFANVSIHGNPFESGSFTGWIIVNGSLSISGNMQILGTVYSVNDFTYNGTGAGRIDGLVVSQNIRDTTATSISDDSVTTGNSRINFDCEAARTPEDWIEPPKFALEPGSYRQVEGDTL